MRRAIIAVALLLLASPACAEVCDKVVGDAWRSADGPVWILNPAGFPSGSLLLASALVVVVLVKRISVGYIAASLVMSYAAVIVFMDLIPRHDLYRMALREGCRSIPTDVVDVAVLLTSAGVCAWLGHRLSRTHGKAA